MDWLWLQHVLTPKPNQNWTFMKILFSTSDCSSSIINTRKPDKGQSNLGSLPWYSWIGTFNHAKILRQKLFKDYVVTTYTHICIWSQLSSILKLALKIIPLLVSMTANLQHLSCNTAADLVPHSPTYLQPLSWNTAADLVPHSPTYLQPLSWNTAADLVPTLQPYISPISLLKYSCWPSSFPTLSPTSLLKYSCWPSSLQPYISPTSLLKYSCWPSSFPTLSPTSLLKYSCWPSSLQPYISPTSLLKYSCWPSSYLTALHISNLSPEIQLLT